MKKGIKILGIVLAVLLALIIIVPMALRGKIGDIVKTEANKMLNAQLDFESLDISLIRRFPKASLELRGLTLVGVDKFEGDTIVAADRISVAVDVMSLFGDDGFEVSKVLLVRPSVYGHKLADGSVNWDVMKPSDKDDDEEESDDASAFSLSLKAFDIEGAQLRYADDSTKMYAATMPLDLSLKGDLSAAHSTLKLKMAAGGLTYRSEGTTLLSGAHAELDAAVDADLENNRYTLSDNTLKLNNIALSLDGWVELDDDAMRMDIKANTSRVEFRDILSMIPAFYTRDFKNLTAGGAMTLAAWVKGEMKGDRLPAFNVALKVSDGSFKYASLPQGVTGINIDAAVANAGGTADATVADISKFTATFAGNTLGATLHAATPVSDLDFAASAVGKVDLGAIKDVYPLGDSIRLDGKLTVDLKAAARMSDIEKERFEKINAEGSFVLEDMEAEISGLPEVKIRRAAASITPQAMTLSDFTVNVGRSDLAAHGRLTDYLAYVLRDETLHGSLTVTSNLIDLNEITGYVPADDNAETEAAPQEEQPAAEGASMAIPKNLDLSLATSVKELLFQKMEISDFKGALRMRNGILSVDQLSMKAFGGSVTAAPASYDTSNPEAPKMKFNCSIANASFSETFRQLDMIKKIVPLFEKTGGDYSMKLDLTSDLTPDLSPVYNSIQATGELSSQNIHLNNVVAFDKLAEALKNDKLKKIEAKDVKIAFTVKDGRVTTKPFDIKMGNINLNLSGSTGLDQTIDYAGKVTLPEGATNGILSTVGLNIGGTFTSPKISVDVKEAAKEAVTNVVNDQLKKLTGSENLGEEFERQAEKIRSEAAKAGEKLVNEAKKQRENLVNKASNALTKLAAEKSGDALVKEAEKQSEKLQAEAEKQIEALRAKMSAQQN